MLRRRCVEAAIDVVTNRRKVGRQSPKLEMERRSMKQRRLLANSQEAGGTGAGASSSSVGRYRVYGSGCKKKKGALKPARDELEAQ